MRQAKLFRYQLPMDSGVIVRSQHLTTREGWIVQLTDGEQSGWGEIAPLPSFSEEDATQAGEQTKDALALVFGYVF